MDFQRLRSKWLSERVAVLDGLPGSAIEEFEAKNSVQLPSDFRDFYLAMNGMPPGDCDHEFVHVFPLSDVRPAHEFLEERVDDGLFAFADWALNAFVYAIALRGGKYAVGTIVEACADEVVAASFRDFVESSRKSDSRSWPL